MTSELMLLYLQLYKIATMRSLYLLEYTILNMADQLPNMLPGLVAKNPVGAALGMTFFATQLNKEYSTKVYTAMAAKKHGIHPSEVTPQMLS